MSEVAATASSAPAASETPAAAQNAHQSNAPETQQTPEASKGPESQSNSERKFKVKVNGQEQEVTEKELLEGYQTRKAADEKFREAAMTRKQAEEFINMLKQDPLKVLTDPRLGIDARKLAEEYLVAQLEEEMLDPKEKELRQLKKEKEERQKAEEEAKKAKEQAEAEQIKIQWAETYTKQVTEALETSGLPRTEHTVSRIAYYMREGLKRGVELSAQDVVPMVREEYANEQRALIASLDGEALINFIGPEIADRIRKHDLSKLKDPKQMLQKPDKQPEAKEPSSKPVKKFTKDEWKERLERIKRGEE